VLGMPELHDGAQWHLREVRYLRCDERLQLRNNGISGEATFLLY
jgi:hypothetical protein